MYLLDRFLLLGVRLPQAFKHFDFDLLELFLLPLFLRDLSGFLHEVDFVHGVEGVELDPLLLRVLDPERLGEDAIVELLLLDPLKVRPVQHAPLLAVKLCFLLHFLHVLLVLVLEFDLRLAHGVPALGRQLDQLFRAQHFRLVVEHSTSHILFLLALETEHVLGFPACLLHFLDGNLFLFLEDLDAVTELEHILFLLQACAASLLPAGKAFRSLRSGLLR